jgi:hypothetical protein
MTVIINELEHVLAPEGRAEPTRSAGPAGSGQEGSHDVRATKLLSLIRREASRQARLWAD